MYMKFGLDIRNGNNWDAHASKTRWFSIWIKFRVLQNRIRPAKHGINSDFDYRGLLYPHVNHSFITIIQFNSILYYLCDESTATRPITDTAQRKYNNNNSNNSTIIIIIIMGKVKTPFNYNVLTMMMMTIIQFNSIQFKFICVQKLNSPEATYKVSTVINE
jgi:hypothetical protein